MFLSTNSPNMPSMPRHILQHRNTHRELLTIGKALIPLGIRIKLLLIDTRELVRINRQQLILLVPVTHKSGTPAAIRLLEEEAESTVCLGVDFAAVDGEALRNGRFHLGNGSRGVGGDVCRHAVAAVHDKGAFVHAGLGCGDKVFMVDSAGPGGVYVGVWVEN